ncbi:hypothetical protein CSKR_110824 [Clonorchis sinensis]|uniref:Uncharacterized protein n=1 Tax=Clonorchis sinensis TaxID=79923 RepID=A0A3R7DH74_CLOSI|nr:hypothetical protein CSKR_110824 [Clonorchis sinensis]
MSPRLGTKRLQANCQARRTDQLPSDQPPVKKLKRNLGNHTHLHINLAFTGDSIKSLVEDILQPNVLHKDHLMFQLVFKILQNSETSYIVRKPAARYELCADLAGLTIVLYPGSGDEMAQLGQPGSFPALVLLNEAERFFEPRVMPAAHYFWCADYSHWHQKLHYLRRVLSQ